MSDDDWRKVIDVNLSGAFYLSQAALRHMLERGSGRIINISSVIGEMGNIGQSNYASAKSGLFGLTKTLAREACFQLQRSGKLGDGIGVTVNTVTPGYIATEMVQAVPENVRGPSPRRSRWAGWGAPRRWPGSSTSWPPTPPVTSPARSGRQRWPGHVGLPSMCGDGQAEVLPAGPPA